MKSKGWKNEPYRHSLASKGIESTHSKVKQFHKSTQDYPPPEPKWRDLLLTASFNKSSRKRGKKEVQKMLNLFWWCSITDNWEYFDFGEVFERTKDYLYHHLVQSFDARLYDYVNHYPDGTETEWYKTVRHAMDNLSNLSDNEFDELHIALFEIAPNRYEQQYKDSLELYQKLLEADSYNLQEKIQLFDELIHIEHDRGNLWNIDDMDKLRNEFEEEYL